MENFEPKIDKKIAKASELRHGKIFKITDTEKWLNKHFVAIDVNLPTMNGNEIIHDPIKKEGIKAIEVELADGNWKPPTNEINEIFIDINEEVEIIE